MAIVSPRVFISYSHDSSEHKELVLRLAHRLRNDGVDAQIDQSVSGRPSEGWPRWMLDKIDWAEFVLLVCTETYYRRFRGQEESGKGKGVDWEGGLITYQIYNAKSRTKKFVPVVFNTAEREFIPEPISDHSYCLDSEDSYHELYRFLTGQAGVSLPKLGSIKELPRRNLEPLIFEHPSKSTASVTTKDSPALQVFLSKLPTTAGTLFGREKELAFLDKAWDDSLTHVVMLAAWGGAGKTALVNHWLNRLEQQHYGRAERVYGWSFYIQGATPDQQSSADEFLAHALQWFGDPDPAQGVPWDKGVRLAGLIRKHRTLLILDGAEPLQDTSGELHGRFKDQGLHALLKELARAGADWGLCVITTRLSPPELLEMKGTSVQEVQLENLSEDAGAKLLRSLGVRKATEGELQRAVSEFKGHALALTLLGRYLAVVHDGEIRKRDLIPLLEELPEDRGRHARRVMTSYEAWLKNESELEILYLLGLFDRPADRGSMAVLREKPRIKGLTRRVSQLSEMGWKFAVERLRNLRLLDPSAPDQPETLDCHPLIREHFGAVLELQVRSAWREAHNRLFEHFMTVPKKQQPDGMTEMEPLYRAVAHGCRAGKHDEAQIMFYLRICRKEELYSARKLGAYAADLAALSGFFRQPWMHPLDELTASQKAYVLSSVSFRLLALGRIREAAESAVGGLRIDVEAENLGEAARTASRLCEYHLILGEIQNAISYGQRGVELADKSDDSYHRVRRRASLADALHQAGDLQQAKFLFDEAEALLPQAGPTTRILNSFAGHQYCDLLLTMNLLDQVASRAHEIVRFAGRKQAPLEGALGYLDLSRVALLRSQSTKEDSRPDAGEYLTRAGVLLRQASRQDQMAPYFIAQAAWHRNKRQFGEAWQDLADAREIAERGDMRLHLADIRLEATRLSLAEGERHRARDNLAIARQMIDKMQYGRRKPEVDELEKILVTT